MTAISNLNNLKDVTSYDFTLPFSSQRLRYFKESGGSLKRKFVKYGQSNGISEFDTFKRITSSSGKVSKIKTARGFSLESGRQASPSFIFKLNRSLNSGERVVFGIGDPDLANGMENAEGYFFEVAPELSSNEVYFSIYNKGNLLNEGEKKEVIDIENSILSWNKLSCNIYPGPFSTALIYNNFSASLKDGTFDTRVGKVSTDGSIGPESLLSHLNFNVKGNGLSIDVRSTSIKKETINKPVRIKQLGVDAIPVGTVGTWVPVAAARQMPDRKMIQGALNSFTLTDFTSDGYVQAVVQSFAKNKVTFSGADSWQITPPLSKDGTTIQTRVDVDQISNQSGSLVSETKMPGGNLIARSVAKLVSDSSSGGGPPPFNSGNSSTLIQDTFSPNENPENFFNDDDIFVVLVQVENAGDISFEFKFRENW